MKKIIITLMFITPFLASASTVQEQYESALRQVIVLLQQQVTVLIAQLNALNAQQAKVEPTYTYTPIPTTSMVVPEIPTPVITVGSTQVSTSTPAPTPTPTVVWSEVQSSENVTDYSIKNNTSSTVTYSNIVVEVTPKTIVNNFSEIKLEAVFNGYPFPIVKTSKPETTTTYTIPVNFSLKANQIGNVHVETGALGTTNPNDRFIIRLISYN